jgi:outer membrane receptor protein involved in Fe transport
VKVPRKAPDQIKRDNELNLLKRITKVHAFIFTLFTMLMGVNALALETPMPEGVMEFPEMVIIPNTPIGTGAALDETPTNAQSFHAQEITEQGHTNLADLLDANVGSVTVSNATGNPYQNDVNYRGFQATSLLGAPVGLSVFVDGVRMNEPFGSIVNWDLIPMNAISNLTVLPGSNPLFGLNTLGGALVIQTKNGKDDQGTAISFLGGSFQRQATRFESGWFDKEHEIDFFISGNVDRQDGWRDHSGLEVNQLFAKLGWTGNGAQTRIELTGSYVTNSLSGTQSLPQDMLSNRQGAYTWPDTISNTNTIVNLKASHWLAETNQLVGQVYYRHANLNNFNSNAQLDDGCASSDCSNSAPNGTAVNCITSPAALALGYSQYGCNINSSVVNSTTVEDTVGTAVQWSNFANVAGHQNTFIFGGRLEQSQTNYSQSTYLAQLINYQTVIVPNAQYGFTANGLAPSATNPAIFSGSNLIKSVGLQATNKDMSLFLTNTMHTTDRLNITAGASFNFTSIDQSGANTTYLGQDGSATWSDQSGSFYNPSYLGAWNPSNTQNTIPSGAVANETNSLIGSHSYQRLNPSIGLNYKLDANNGIFASYSESMRSPTSVELSCANPNSPCTLPTGFNSDPDLKAVVAKTYELGGRGKWFGMDWNAAVFDSRLSDDIQYLNAPDSTTFGYFSNVGDTERRGVELGLKTHVNKLYVSANYGYVNAIFKSNFTTASGQNVTSGNSIPGIPSSTLKIRAAYSLSNNWLIGANLIAVSDQYMHGNESNSDPTGKVAGYAIVNLDLHYRANDNLSFFANVNNVFNNQYASFGQYGVQSIYTLATQNFITPAPPIAIWAGLTYTFGGKRLKPVDKD